MQIISVRTLREFWERPGRRDSEKPLRAWYAEMKEADWSGPNDLKLQYPTVSIIGSNRFVFNIKGNKYRLIVIIKFEHHIIFIRFVATHKEYDKVDAGNI